MKKESVNALPSPEKPRGSRYLIFLGASVIILAVGIIYFPAIGGQFVLDDDSLLTENALVKAPDGLSRIWFTAQASDYWPVTNTSFWIEWRLWEMNPIGYHFTNIILYAASCLLLWAVLRLGEVPGAFGAALLYAVHPVNVESTAWIAQRKDVLAFFFFLWAAYGYLRAEPQSKSLDKQIYPPKSFPWYGFSLATFLLAMLSKGSVAVFPVLMLLWIAWRRKIVRRDFIRLAPFFIVAVVLAGVNVWFQTHGVDVIRVASGTERILGASAAVWFYLYKAIFPWNLTFVYPLWKIDPSQAVWWLPLIGLIALTAILWGLRKTRGRPLLFGWLFFLTALLPVVGLVDVGFMKFSLVADRYQHIAILGILVPVAAGWSLLQNRYFSETGRRIIDEVAVVAGGALSAFVWVPAVVLRFLQESFFSEFGRAAINAIAVLVIGGFMAISWRQSGMYRDVYTLYQTTIERNPECWLAYNNLGLRYSRDKRLPDALECYKIAARLRPELGMSHFNLGTTLMDLGDAPGAITSFELALKCYEDYDKARANLGVAYERVGRHADAVACFEEVVRKTPVYPEAYFYLAVAYAGMHRMADAAAAARTALQQARDQGKASLVKEIEAWLAGLPDGQ